MVRGKRAQDKGNGEFRGCAGSDQKRMAGKRSDTSKVRAGDG